MADPMALVERLHNPMIDLGGNLMPGSAERDMLEAAGEIERLRAALAQCAAEFKTAPGTVLSAAAEVQREFARRMEIADKALNGDAVS